MKYYKIVETKGRRGLKHLIGDCTTGIYFAKEDIRSLWDGIRLTGGINFAKEDILAFLGSGTKLYEVEPIGPVYENPGKPKNYKAHAVYLKYIGNVQDNIEFLIKQGADVHAGNNAALFYAIKQNNLELVKLLLEHGADVNNQDGFPLRFAASYNNLELAKLLLDYGADANCRGGLPLKFAINYGDLKLVKLLLKHGADVHANNGEPIKLAESRGDERIIKVIHQYF